MKKINARLVMVENEEDFTEEFLNKVQAEYLPEQVFYRIQRNLANGNTDGYGTSETLGDRTAVATVDATTFDMYLANMRTMVMEQLFQADVVIFNRCDDSTDKGKCRRNVKAQNRKAQLVFEREDGSLTNVRRNFRLIFLRM